MLIPVLTSEPALKFLQEIKKKWKALKTFYELLEGAWGDIASKGGAQPPPDAYVSLSDCLFGNASWELGKNGLLNQSCSRSGSLGFLFQRIRTIEARDHFQLLRLISWDKMIQPELIKSAPIETVKRYLPVSLLMKNTSLPQQ